MIFKVDEHIREVVDKLDIADKNVYKDKNEISNYNQPGSIFFKKNDKQILDITVEDAIEKGLKPSEEMAFRKGSDIYKKADKGTKMWLSREAEILQKAYNILCGMKKWDVYFNPKTTSLTADLLSKYNRFISIDAPYAKIQRLPLHTFNKFYRPNGEVFVGQELDRVRIKIKYKSDSIHNMLDSQLKEALGSLKDALSEPDNQNIDKTLEQEMWPKKRAQIEKMASPSYMAKELMEFFETPKNLEIKNASIDEITSRLKARNVKQGFSLNQPPDGFILKLALQDCMIDGKLEDGKLIISSHDFDPDQLNTYGINAHFKNPKIKEYANEWFTYSIKTFGVEGALKFYEMVGFVMVTKFPPPSERTYLVIIGDPGSGKGTHLSALEELLTFDGVRLFAKVDPHKLTDPREHFSMQNLGGKLAVIAGDLKHTKIRDFAPVNDLFGGEPAEIERKFKDKTTENLTLKAFWASTPPLFKIDQPGGAWRRMNIITTNPVDSKDRDNELKPKLLERKDGIFFNGLIGLAYLASNGWKITGEMSDDEIENIWAFQSDSVAVFAERIYPEPEYIDSGIENIEKRRVIDDLYAEYEAWANKKQIEPVKPKTFTAWLRNHDFEISRKKIEEGEWRGKYKYVTYLTDDREKGDYDKTKNESDPDLMHWEAFISKAPVILKADSDSLGQNSHIIKENNNENSSLYIEGMPSRIGIDENNSQKPNNTRFPDDKNRIRFVSEDSKGQKTDSLETKNETTDANLKYFRYEVLKHYIANGLAHNPGDHFNLPEYLKDLVEQGLVKCLNCEDNSNQSETKPLTYRTYYYKVTMNLDRYSTESFFTGSDIHFLEFTPIGNFGLLKLRIPDKLKDTPNGWLGFLNDSREIKENEYNNGLRGDSQ